MPWIKSQTELRQLRICFGELGALSTQSSNRRMGIEQTAAKIVDAIVAGLDADVAYLAFPIVGEAKLREITRCNPDTVDLGQYLDTIRTHAHAPSQDLTSPAFLIESSGIRLVCKALQPDGPATLIVGSRKPSFPNDAQHILLDIAAAQLAQGLERQGTARNTKRLATKDTQSTKEQEQQQVMLPQTHLAGH